MFLGVLMFSKLIDFFLAYYEIPTRFCFLGLILGTLPMIWQEVKKQGFRRIYYSVILFSFFLGSWFFTVNPNAFPQIETPNLFQCILLGISVAATAIIPGVDPAVFLSTLGFYEMYVRALANLDFSILLPMVVGLGLGAVSISFIMSTLFGYLYTGTYSVIFGIFLSMIPNMLSENCTLSWNTQSFVSIALMIIGFFISFYLGDLETNNLRLKKIFTRK